MLNKNIMKGSKDRIIKIINSLIGIIKNPEIIVSDSAYFYHIKEKNNFIIHLYLFKLLINDNGYLDTKYNEYISKFGNKTKYLVNRITNIDAKDELDLLYKVKIKIKDLDYLYSDKESRIYFKDGTYVNSTWFITLISLVLDNVRSDDFKEINICYTIASRDITRLENNMDIEKFLANFSYYNITVRRTNKTRMIHENDILLVKNAAVNYLKHLKRFKEGLENSDTYKVFYELLKKECLKNNFLLISNQGCLIDVNKKELDTIYDFIDKDFYKYDLSKQVKIIENAVWQHSNDLTLLEYINRSIDSLMDFLMIIRLESKSNFNTIKKNHNINDIKLLLVLAVNKFLLTYLDESVDIDYSLLSLSNIRPRYMNSIYEEDEEEITSLLRNYNIELNYASRKLKENKLARQNINREELTDLQYKNELEKCVSEINRYSIMVARLNSKVASVFKDYESLKKKKGLKYHNVDTYNYHYSIIRHLCNSILGCNYYMKTNNRVSVFNNIIIFEDYNKTDNSFYLEISFNDLIRISDNYVVNGVIEEGGLPKLL